MEEREEFLTARQLAKVLQVSESTVRRLARKRRIPSVRVTPHIIRFHLDAVREALDVPRHRIRHGEFTEPVDDAPMLNPGSSSLVTIHHLLFTIHYLRFTNLENSIHLPSCFT